MYDQLRHMTLRPLKYLGQEYPAGVLLPEGGDVFALRHMEHVGMVAKAMPKIVAPAKKPRVADTREITGFTPQGEPVYAKED